MLTRTSQSSTNPLVASCPSLNQGLNTKVHTAIHSACRRFGKSWVIQLVRTSSSDPLNLSEFSAFVGLDADLETLNLYWKNLSLFLIPSYSLVSLNRSWFRFSESVCLIIPNVLPFVYLIFQNRSTHRAVIFWWRKKPCSGRRSPHLSRNHWSYGGKYLNISASALADPIWAGRREVVTEQKVGQKLFVLQR